MEIQYLWIKNFRSIEKQGFNFGGKYIFDFDYKNGNLFFEENNQFIPDFFGSKTSNVTALIGANGSGKSTVLDFIKLNISHDIGITNLHFLCLYKEKGRSEIFIYNSTGKKLKLPKGKESLFHTTDRGYIDGHIGSLLFPTAFVFYSPSIDFNYDQEFTSIDLSTTHLLKKSEDSEYSHGKNSFYELAHNEMKMQLSFASRYKRILPFLLPEELHMNPNFFKETKITRSLKLGDKLISELTKWGGVIDAEIYELRGQLLQETVEIYKALFWHTINFLLKTIPSGDIRVALEKQTIKKSNATWELLRNLYSNESFLLPQWLQVESFFEILTKLEDEEIMYYFFARFNFKIRPTRNFQKIDALLNTYYDISVVGDFLRFYWSGLSMGEQSIFSMFARFYDARHEIKDKFMSYINDCRVNVWKMPRFEGKPDVVILMDEGEVHLHPQWQKEFVYNLVNYLPNIINVPKIQLILASNSPFLISDLPNHNVVFLESKKEKTIVQKKQPISFASNIHELLANSFFLDIPIGKFAENKINEVINSLNEEKDLSSEKVKYIHKIIRLIDDTTIQNKLIQLFALKIEGDDWEQHSLEHQRKIIDEKLNNLKKI